MAKSWMAIFIDGIVASQCLTQMRVEALFFTASTPATKGNQMQHVGGVLCHKIKGSALHAFAHSLKGCIVVGWLASDIAKPFTGKVSLKDKDFTMIVPV
jgi:hypothetical protein